MLSFLTLPWSWCLFTAITVTKTRATDSSFKKGDEASILPLLWYEVQCFLRTFTSRENCRYITPKQVSSLRYPSEGFIPEHFGSVSQNVKDVPAVWKQSMKLVSHANSLFRCTRSAYNSCAHPIRPWARIKNKDCVRHFIKPS